MPSNSQDLTSVIEKTFTWKDTRHMVEASMVEVRHFFHAPHNSLGAVIHASLPLHSSSNIGAEGHTRGGGVQEPAWLRSTMSQIKTNIFIFNSSIDIASRSL